MPLPEDVLAALHSRLESLEAGYARRLTDAYRVVLQRLVPEAEAFAAQMQTRVDTGRALTANQIRQLRRYRAFIAQAQAEGRVARGECPTWRENALERAGELFLAGKWDESRRAARKFEEN